MGAGEVLALAALGVLDLRPSRLALLVNRQAYNERNSPLCISSGCFQALSRVFLGEK
jgi:hypothetical protein